MNPLGHFHRLRGKYNHYRNTLFFFFPCKAANNFVRQFYFTGS